ncbi:GH43 family beta-xylosidase [Paenibacillus phyllosphaerae]|uniref:GH43 family beta-xylosidase n=1 Tax=Paenibacillus phyllosphaerae TaxID=274593 RepID=A0A7W5AZV8_9BACL|nr:family 43 glycosylhydrolase [Paenibacillus phyllosphaerae]MBB3111844.1 GH43 family beta-xylosidase [Paenibacillus phyllosphaerae]
MQKSTHMKIRLAAAVLLVVAIGLGAWFAMTRNNEEAEVYAAYNGHGGTFKNTLVPFDTPDPSVVYKDGYYYMTFTHNGADVMVLKSRTIDFKQAERKTVWYPDVGTAYSANLWAPEIQYLQGKWYIYFAADDGANENHRMYALEADTDDPMGSYTFKGQVTDETNKWAIDGLAMELNGKLYFVWSGWEGEINIQQNTYIAPMSDPLTISGPRVLLSEPDLAWEKAGGPPYINEGQSILHQDGRVHIVYSGAGSWTPFYALGMLTLEEGADPLIPANWKKAEQPFLKMDEDAGVYGPGHNSFVTSPDGEEQWIVYHATTAPTDGWSNRRARAQKLAWDADGNLQLGKPLSLDTAIPVPAGTGVFKAAPGGKEAVFDLIPSKVPTVAAILLHYRNDSGEAQEASIRAGSAAPISISLPPVDGTGYTYADIPLEAGMNEIAIAVDGDQASIEAIELPRYEAENATALTHGTIEENAFTTSGFGYAVLSSGEEEALRFDNVIVPVSGVYQIRLQAANAAGQAAKLTVRTSGGKSDEIVIPSGGRNDFQPQTISLQLSAGPNTLILEHATDEVQLDYIDVTRTLTP